MSSRPDLPSATAARNKPERAYGFLTRELNARRWVPGDRLPSAAELADELDVSRPLVLQAFNQLSDEGRLTVRPGRGGVHVNPWEASRASRLANARAKPDTGLEWVAFLEFAEPGVARRLALRGLDPATAGRLDELSSELSEVATDDQDRAVRLDHQFHQLLAEASGSKVVQVLSMVGRSWADGLRDLVGTGVIDPPMAARDHIRLLTAIRAGDGTAAADIAITHITPLLDDVTELIEPSQPQTADRPA